MDFAKMLQTWINVTTKPSEATFEGELNQPQVSLGTAVIWIVIAAVVLAVLSAIGAVISGFIGGGASFMQTILEQADLPPDVRDQMMAQFAAQGAGGGVIGALCGALIAAPIGFLIGAVIYFAVAKIFGGTGTFEQHTYALATFSAPLMIVSGALNVIPFVGGCLGILVSLYQIFLTYLAMKVTHRLSSGAALAVALIPVIIVLICMCVIVFAVVSLLAGAAGGSFE